MVKQVIRRRDLVITPICEAALLFVAAAVGLAVRQPLIFASLGPTAYELVEMPERKSARTYNVVVGHLVGVLAAFLALYVTHARRTPVIGSGAIEWPRIEAVVLAALLTAAVTLLIRATQPAALSSTLLISLGSMQKWQDGFLIMGGVLLMVIVGAPIRFWRLRNKQQLRQQAEQNA